ncbi:hypothetical protein HNQ60_004075 [Povalibacter uvarum]|uniref:Outer membrane protein beta-barrel domain-containing protein n=1 Tax=Povalibacter uvarum TaxID=732238 RepID=A0A841HTL1_9GAMM|nr:hypothetical protein [Povalibacter uvarum]MBB6095185.1 hypothetical protein [Povalibacter uvarum]
MNKIASLCIASSMLLLSSVASADPLWPLDRKFEANLGVFFLDTDTTIRLDANNQDLGTQVNLEDELGLDSQDRFRIDGYWRFLDRHKLRFMYFDSSSSSSRNIEREIEFGDETFPLNAFVKVSFDVTIFELAYEYSFMKRDNFELSGTIGLHNLSIGARLLAEASSNQGAGGIDRDAKADGDGPLPVIGFRGVWALSDHFYFDAQAQFFALEFDEYDGDLQDYKISFTWMPIRNFGVGVGYNKFTTSLDVDKEHFNGTLRFEYGGPLLFITGAF